MCISGPQTRGSHLHVACRSICDHDQVLWSAKSVLDHSLLRLLIAWFPRVKGHIAAVHPWSMIFSSLEVTLIPWSAPQKGFDCLIQFWSRSQALLHRTCDYPLPDPSGWGLKGMGSRLAHVSDLSLTQVHWIKHIPHWTLTTPPSCDFLTIR